MKSLYGNASTVVMAAAVGAVGFFIYYGRAHWGISVGDEGYILELSERVRQGAVPYRDFYTLYPPNIYYGLSWIFQLFGPSLLASRTAMALVKAAILIMSFLLARRLVSNRMAVLAPTLVWLVDLTAGLSLIPYAALVAELLILISWWLLSAEPRTRRFAFLAGASCALAFTFKQPVGALAMLACLVWLAQPLWRRRPLFYLVPLAAVGLLIFPFLPDFQVRRLFFAIPALLSLIVIFQSESHPGRSPALARLTQFILGGAIAIVLWGVAATYEIGWSLWPGVIWNPILDASRRFDVSSMWTWILGAEFILLLYTGAFFLTLGFLLKTPQAPGFRTVQLGLLMTGFLIATLYPWPASTRASWISAPFFILLVWSIDYIKKNFFLLSWQKGLAVAALTLLFLLVTIWFMPRVVDDTRALISRSGTTLAASLHHFSPWKDRDSTQRWEGIDRAAGISDDSPEAISLVQLIAWLREHTSKSETLVVYPRGEMIYFLAGRPNPSYYGAPGLRFFDDRPSANVDGVTLTKADWFILAEDAAPGTKQALIRERFQPVFRTTTHTVFKKVED